MEYVRDVCEVGVATGYGLVTHIYNSKKNIIDHKNTSFLCTIGDYLGMVLTGRKKPLLHISNASSLGFFDAKRRKFMDEKLRVLEVDLGILPEVTDEFTSLEEYRNIKVSVAIGDNQASFLGSVGIKKDTVLLNMGTGGHISVLSEQYFEASGIEARPFTKDKYLLVGSSLCGGRAYAILEKFFRTYVIAAGMKDEPQYKIMNKLAEESFLECDQMKVITTYKGTRENPNEKGSITNITEENFNPVCLIRGVIKGMAQELYDMYAKIHDDTGISANHLVASGNGLRKNKVLQQVFSQMFHTQLSLAPYEEEAACGAAISSIYQLEK